MNENNPILETKEFKLLLNLLEKTEQIISIINLPDSSISKYNTLKKMTFDMLNINFVPLKKKVLYKDVTEKNIENKEETLNILYMLNNQKIMLIELLLDFIKNNNSVYQDKKLNHYLGSLTEIYNLSKEPFNNKSEGEILYEINSETEKLSETFTKIDKIFVDNFDINKQIRMNYENELNKLREKYDRDLDELKISLGKNSFQKEDYIENQNLGYKTNDYLNRLSYLIDESYKKYQRCFPNEEFGNNWINNINDLKLDFLERVMNFFFEKNYKLPNKDLVLNKEYCCKNCYSNKKFDDICSFLPSVQKESDIFHKKFCDLMNYIETNINGNS